MLALAVVFPGQGSQSLGMLQSLAAEFSLVVDTFAEASAVLGYDLWDLVQHDEQRLHQTFYTQAAMLVSDIAVWRVCQACCGLQAAWLAGHSLGEYAALVAAEALDFSVAVDLVAKRGQFMQEAVPAGSGAVAAIVGLQDQQVLELCQSVAAYGLVEIANYNSIGQVVVAGERVAVEQLLSAAKAAGAKLAKLIPVSVPVHCRLMQPAALRLGAWLNQVPFKPARAKVIHNTDLSQASDAAAIRVALTRQLTTPVRWVETIQYLAAAGVEHIIECGPGKVLAGLVKRIDSKLQVLSVHQPEGLVELKQLLAALK